MKSIAFKLYLDSENIFFTYGLSTISYLSKKTKKEIADNKLNS